MTLFRNPCLPCFLCLWTLFPNLSQALEPEPPLFEDYLHGTQNLEAFVRDAHSFVIKNPKSIHAPRITHDLLVFGTLSKQDGIIDMAQRVLLLDFVDSPHGRYFLNSFKEAKELRTLLIGLSGNSGAKVFSLKFCRAAKAGFRRFGTSFFDDEAFQVKSYLHACLAEDEELKGGMLHPLRRRLEEKGDDHPQLSILLDEKLSSLEKFKRFHEIMNGDNEGELASYLDFHAKLLSEKERASPEVLEILANQAAWSLSEKGALELLDALPDSRRSTPLHLLLRAKVQWSGGSGEGALRDLAKAAKGKGPWAELAPQLAEGISHWEERRDALAKVFLAISKSFNPESAGLEVEVSLSTKKKSADDLNFTGYLAFLPKKNELALEVINRGKLVFAYRTSKESSSLYLGNRREIMEFASGGPVPAPNFALNRSSDGQFHLTGGAMMAPSLDAAKKSGSSLFDSPYLSTEKGLGILLQYTIPRRGGWIEKSRREKKLDLHSIRWPERFNPDGFRAELGVCDKGSLRSVKVNNLDGSFRAEAKIRYGEKNFSARPLQWPDLPVRKRQEFDFTVITEILGAMSGLVDQSGGGSF